MKKRFLSFMLVAAMLLSFMPVMAFADGLPGGAAWIDGTGTTPVWYKLEEEPASSGKYTLTIGGTGAMPDFSGFGKQPWGTSRAAITTVVVNSGITSIGKNAFYNCTELTSVTIPGSVESIGLGAFHSCSKLNQLHIGNIASWCNISFANEYSNPFSGNAAENKAVYIGGDATPTTKIVIPNSVKTINQYAFQNFSSITEITIPSSVESIGKDAFSGCRKLNELHIGNIERWCNISFANDKSNPFSSDAADKNVYMGGDATPTTKIVIPNSVKTIKQYAFYNFDSITKVTIPDTVTSIGQGAFRGCTGLTSVIIPNSVTSIGDSAFVNCTGLTDVTSPSSIQTIGRDAFGGLSATATFWDTDNNWAVLNEDITADYTFESTKTYLVLGTVAVDSKLTVVDGAKFFYGTNSYFKGGTLSELPKRYTTSGSVDSFQIVEKELGTADNPWNVGTSGHESEVNAYVTQNLTVKVLYITGGGMIGSLANISDATKAAVTVISVEDKTVTGAASNVFDGFESVSLTLPDGWQGDLPDEDGNWYGAQNVALESYPNTVRNVTFQQRYPWNGKVDITTEIRGAGPLGITVAAFKKNGSAWEPVNISAILGETSINLGYGAIESLRFVWDAAVDLNNEALNDIYVEVGLVGKVSGSSIEGKVDLRKEVALPEGATTVAGVTWSDTAWTGEGNANVSIGWKKAGTSDVGSLAEGRLGEGVGEFYLPKRDGAYKLTHSTGSLESFVTYTVSGYPVKNITNGTAADAKGSISIGTTSAVVSETVTVTVNPDSGYVLKDLTVFKTDASTTTIAAIKKSDSTYEFTMPAYDVTVKAEFELAPITNVDITIGTVSLDTVKGLGDGSRPTINVVDNSTATNLLNQNTGLYEAYLLDSKCNVLYGYNTGLLESTDKSWYSYNGTFAKTDYTNVKFDKVEKIGLVYCICGQNQDNYKLPATASDLTVKVNSVELPISTIEKSVSNNTNNFNIDGDRIYVCYVCDIIKSSPSYYIIVERNESNYSVAAEVAKNGTVSVDKSSVAADGTVTITVAPDKGFVLDALTVLDVNGKEVGVNNLGNGKYSFTMPKSNVSVKASFVKEQTVVNSFVDVKEGDYFYDAVLWAIENGITDGVDATHFNPSGITNRAQMVTFLWRAAGCPEPTLTACPFADVESGSYYDKAVLWAYENGITGGTSATTFDPNANVNRAQVVTFLWRYSGGLSVDYWMQMSDVASGEYYSEAVRWALAEKITDGTSKTTFSPEDDCLRGQAVTFLYRGFGE